MKKDKAKKNAYSVNQQCFLDKVRALIVAQRAIPDEWRHTTFAKNGADSGHVSRR